MNLGKVLQLSYEVSKIRLLARNLGLLRTSVGKQYNLVLA